MNELPVHNFIFQHSRRHCPNIYFTSWNQLLYPRVIEVCRLPFEPRHDFLHLIIVIELFFQRDVSLGEETSGNRWVTINSNNLFVYFHWTFTFCVEKLCDGMHLAFGWILDQRCHFKHVSIKQSQLYHCQMSTAHR